MPVLAPQPLATLYKKLHIEKTGFLKWEDLKTHALPEDFADMLGWEEAARKTAAYQSLTEAEKQRTLIFCDNYGFAGALNYYAGKYHIPPAYSDNASFLYWIPQNIVIRQLILATGDRDELQHDFVKDFQSARVTDSIVSPYSRERGSRIYLFKGANDHFNYFFRNKIAQDKAAFN